MEYPITPAVRLLREKKVEFAPHLYDYEEHGGTRRSAEVLVTQFRPFVTVGMAAVTAVAATGVAALPPNMLDMPIEELDLPMRAYNSLKRNNIVKVGQLLQLKDDDLLRMRNFGKKSLDEMKERLRMRGFIVPDTEGDVLDDLDGEEPFEDEPEA